MAPSPSVGAGASCEARARIQSYAARTACMRGLVPTMRPPTFSTLSTTLKKPRQNAGTSARILRRCRSCSERNSSSIPCSLPSLRVGCSVATMASGRIMVRLHALMRSMWK